MNMSVMGTYVSASVGCEPKMVSSHFNKEVPEWEQNNDSNVTTDKMEKFTWN